MHNLWIFLVRYQTFFFFILFEIISISLFLRNNNYQKTSFVNSSNEISGNLYSIENNILYYFSLKETNDSLVAENAALRNMLPQNWLLNKANPSVHRDTVSDYIQEYTYLDAKVINNTINYRNNYLTLNRGSLHGVEKGMGVICQQGVVGIVKDVSEHFCTVISVLHKDARISAKIAESNVMGSIIWEGKDPQIVSIQEIPNHVKASVGQEIVTTGYSLFPENIKIGNITSVPDGSNDALLNMDVHLSTDFRSLQYVYIVVNKLTKEKNELESKLINDK